MIGRRSTLVLVTATGAAAGWGLAALGDVVPGPPTRVEALARWYDAVGPVAAVAGIARWSGVGLAVWVSVASILQLIASTTGLLSLQPIADLLSPRSLQRVGCGLAGLSLTAGLSAPAPSAGTPFVVAPSSAPHQEPRAEDPAADGAGTATMHRVEPSTPASAPEPAPTEREPSLTSVSLPPIVAPSTTTAPVVPTTTSVPPPRAAPSPAAVSAPGPPVAGDPHPVAEPVPAVTTGEPTAVPLPPTASGSSAPADTVVVRPGDSLWSIAEEALLDLTGRAEDRDIVRYWRQVVEANRSALKDPANPDLIFAGQVIALPAP